MTRNDFSKTPQPGGGDWAFAPDSEIWRISRENAVLIGGQAAAILQIAHPRIALGVDEHSHFRENAGKRLFGTLDAVFAIVFGTQAEANAIRDKIAAMHHQVRGNAAAAGVSGPENYSAFEPDLMLWVLATLIMGAIEGHGWVYGPLPLWRRRRYYADMRVFGEYFGLDRNYGPRDWEEFQEYYREMMSGDLLGSHPLCRDLAHCLLFPRRPWWMRLSVPLLRGLPAEFIDEPVRSRLGLEHYAWSPKTSRRVRALIRGLYIFLPPPLRYPPHYRHARKRISFAQSRS